MVTGIALIVVGIMIVIVAGKLIIDATNAGETMLSFILAGGATLMILGGVTKLQYEQRNSTNTVGVETAVMDTTATLKQCILRTAEEQIKRQESAEKLYDSKTSSCYADAIDYTDLYELRDMIADTTNPDSLRKLNNLLYETVNRLDNETHELFKHDRIHE